MTKEIKNQYLKEEYISRINRVTDYINHNLNKKLELESLARMANFSSYHFHRIFSTIVGESLNRYIKRRRLESASNQLVFNPKKTITEIAYNCGFNSSAFFTRVFREHFKMNPSEWKKSALETVYRDYDYSKNTAHTDCVAEKKSGNYSEKNVKEDVDLKHNYIMPDDGASIKPVKVEVKDLSDMTVAYIRHIGFNIYTSSVFDSLLDKLYKWANPRGLMHTKTGVIMVYHDPPGVTELEKRTISLCIKVPENTSVDGEIGKMVMLGSRYAIGSFEATDAEFCLTWDYMICDWLPESGYQLDYNNFYEIYSDYPGTHPDNKWNIDVYIPVKPA
jgi:AraC family transcriptional regulator